jgi:hypothetical protein
MSKEQDLVQKALLAINSSSFLEDIANQEFSKMDQLNNLPWSPEVEQEIIETTKKIKSILQKSELELNNLSKIEEEVNAFIRNKKKPRKP